MMIPGKANGKPAATVAILFTNDRRETDIVKSLPEFPNGFESRIAVEQGFQIWLSCTVPDLRPQGRRVQVFGPDDSGDAESDALVAHSCEKAAHNPHAAASRTDWHSSAKPFYTESEKRSFMRKAVTTSAVQLSEVLQLARRHSQKKDIQALTSPYPSARTKIESSAAATTRR